MLIRCAFLLLFCTAFSLPGKGQAADSLRQLLSQPLPDTLRVLALVELAWEEMEGEALESEALLKEAIGLAQRVQYSKGEASAWNAFGAVEEQRGNTATALVRYQKALAIREQLGDSLGVAALYNNLGTASEAMGQYDQALQFHKHSLEIVETLHDTLRIARSHSNIAGLYEKMGAYFEAFEHVNQARLIFETRNDQPGLANVYAALGHVRFEMGMPGEAHQYYSRALQLREKLGDTERLASALTDLGNVLDEMANPDSSRRAVGLYLRALKLYQDIEDLPGIASVNNNLGVAHKHLGAFERGMEYLKRSLATREELQDRPGLMEVYNSIGDILYGEKKIDEALRYTHLYAEIAHEIKDEKYIQKSYKDFAKLYAAKGQYKLAFENRVLYDELRYKRLDESRAKDLERREARYADERKQIKIERQQQQIALQKSELARITTLRNALASGAVALVLLLALLFNRNRIRERANRELAAKNALIDMERRRADDLLLNVLPESTALELKRSNSVKPVRYESVTVLFTDFQGFTAISEHMDPEVLIGLLDDCFRLFDSIVEKHGLEKIKTIGDSYMCAGGLPVPNNTHALDAVSAAVEMQRSLHRLMTEKSAAGLPVFQMRVGIHTGPVVAGVVGSRKFAYDIWGDTVNTASRLEQGSEKGKINISETTWKQVSSVYPCTFRGDLAAKNKGLIAMYFVEFDLEPTPAQQPAVPENQNKP